MNIGIMARPLKNHAGIGHYTRHLLEGLSHTGAEHRYHLFTNAEEPSPLPSGPWVWHRDHRPTDRVLWEQFVLPKRLRQVAPALFHSPDFTLPLTSRCPSVVTVHDLSFVRYPTGMSRRARILYTILSERSARKADCIIAVSNFTAQEISACWRIPQHKVRVVHEAAAPKYHSGIGRTRIDPMRKELGLGGRYILSLGSIEPRKNLETLLNAFAQVADPHCMLALAGACGTHAERAMDRARELRIADQVRILGYVKERHLPALYAGAEAFVYMSRYEGFGLPPLEAMACGTPTIVSDAGALAEVAGEGAQIVGMNDSVLLAHTIGDLLESKSLRELWGECGIRRAAHFSWDRAARETLSVYKNVAGRSQR